MHHSKEQAERFVEQLADYLAGKGVAKKSMLLQLSDPDAQSWAAMRNATSLFGYPTREEAIEILRRDIIAIGKELEKNV